MKNSKLAIITGSMNGLGKELKLKLFTNNYNIICIDLKYNKNYIFKKNNKKIFYIKKNIKDRNLPKILNQIIKKNNLILDIFINNAGIAYQKKFLNLEISKQLNIIEINNLSLVNLSFFALKNLSKNGTLVNIGSSTAFQPLTYFSVYSSSKIFVDYFTRIVQQEYKDKNILLVHPSGFKSKFNESGNIKISKIKLLDTKNVANKIVNSIIKKDRVLLIGFRAHLIYLFSRIFSVNLQIKFWDKILKKLK